jgi:hypothetical protein
MSESVHMLSIVPSGAAAGRNDGEHPLFSSPGAPSNREIAIVIIGLFAGYEADVKFDPASSHKAAARIAASDDDEKAAVYVRRLCSNGKQRALRERLLRGQARSIVEAHWEPVRALA